LTAKEGGVKLRALDYRVCVCVCIMTRDAVDSVAPSKADATPGHGDWGTKVRRYNWRSAGSLGWPFPTLKYKCIFQRKYTEAISSNSTRKLLWFEISRMPTTVFKNKFVVSFMIILGTLSFPIYRNPAFLRVRARWLTTDDRTMTMISTFIGKVLQLVISYSC